jgi:long-chain acyl-CoA synthetase
MNSDKPWLKHYPEGVAHEIDLSHYCSLVDVFEESFKRYPNRLVLEIMGKTLTYRELDHLSKNFAAYLQSLGLEPGSRIAIMFPNVAEYLVAMLGTLRAGLVVVNINPLYTARELEYQLKDSGASVLIILENFCHVYQQIEDQVALKKVIVSSLGELHGIKGLFINFVARHIKQLVPPWRFPYSRFKEALNLGKGQPFTKPKIDLNDIAFLQYTGGTTGVSKGAMLLHRNILANVIQIESWLEPGLKQVKVEQLVFLCALPLTHIFALTACALLGIRKGGLLILVLNPKDISGFIKLLLRHPDINIFPAVNTLFHALIHRPDFLKVKLPNLLVTIGGGMAVQKKTADLWQKLTGVPIAQGYGLSETSPVVCVNTPLVHSFNGSIGLPLPSTDIAILDDDGIELANGVPGEICIKGPQVMAGYWNQAEETKRFMTIDGFFKSGDIGIMNDDGYITIVDRKKDMIVVAGFKVFPNEIEEVISGMQGVSECAVIGTPHRKLGEVVTAYIVKENTHLTEAQVIQYCKDQMTSYKRPRKIIFVDELPKSNVGKILRRALRPISADL